MLPMLPRGWIKWERFKDAYLHETGTIMLFILTEKSPEGMDEYVLRVMGDVEEDDKCRGFTSLQPDIRFLSRPEAYREMIKFMKIITKSAEAHT